MKWIVYPMQSAATREEGATMVEYSLMIALITIVCLIAVGVLGTSVSDLFDRFVDQFAAMSA